MTRNTGEDPKRNTNLGLEAWSVSMKSFGPYEAGQRPHRNTDGRGPRLCAHDARSRSIRGCGFPGPLTSTAASSKLRAETGAGGVAAPLSVRSVVRREASVLAAEMALLRVTNNAGETLCRGTHLRRVCVPSSQRRRLRQRGQSADRGNQARNELARTEAVCGER